MLYILWNYVSSSSSSSCLMKPSFCSTLSYGRHFFILSLSTNPCSMPQTKQIHVLLHKFSPNCSVSATYLSWKNIFFRTYIDDKQGVMALDVEELEEFVPVPPRPAVSLNSFFRHDDRGNREQIYAKVNDALSPSSNLNRRSDTSMLYNGLSHTSAMNVRYVRLGRDVPNSAAQMPSPSSSDMHLQNGDVHRNNGPTNNLRNGIPLASIPENRNEPPNRMGNNLQAANGREKERQRPIADLPDGDIADMDRWLESVFDQALDGVGNDYGDVQSLGRRIMGGGEDEASLQVRMNCESFQFFFLLYAIVLLCP